jgi:long-subunit acyl-CoA synthetase (AMP-forming)
VDAAVAAAASGPPPPEVLHRASMDDVFGYIYTSGTTGLPKAAVIRHWRMFGYGAAAVNMFLVCACPRVCVCACASVCM